MSQRPRAQSRSRSVPSRNDRKIPKAPPLGDAPRHAAFLAVSRQVRRFPDMDLGAIDSAIDAVMPAADARDRAFAGAIYAASVRRWLTLRYLIERHLTRPWDDTDAKLRGALIGGAAQLLDLTRVPESAAINHAVEWVKAEVGAGPAKAANAVLRRVLTDLGGEARHEDSRGRSAFGFARDELPLAGGSAGAHVLSGVMLPENDVERLAVATNHPTALIRAWMKVRSAGEVRRLCLHSLCDPPIVLNVDHAPDAASDPNLGEHEDPGCRVYTGQPGQLRDVLSSHPSAWVQDSASCRAVRSLRGLQREPRVIIDACAGMGTKTRQLAATFPNARIIATDADEPRAAALSKAFAGSDRVAVVPYRRLREDHHGSADLVLLDVPCSNSGVLPRRPEARFRFDDQRRASLAQMQRQIIADAIPLLAERPRGSILYSTCSLEPEENQAQAAWAEKWHRFRPSRESAVEPRGVPGDGPEVYRDGAYSVLLEG